jgi:hypothetical protein
MPDITLKRGDTLPLIAATLTGPDSLEGATVLFRARHRQQPAIVLERDATITDPNERTVTVALTAEDTAEPGDYDGEFVVGWAGVGEMTLPVDGFLHLRIASDVEPVA